MDSAPSDIAPQAKSGVGFFLALMVLFVGLGATAQGFRPVAGLAWTDLFVFLLVPILAASGSNLFPSRFLLLARRPTKRQVLLGVAAGGALFLAASGIMSLTTLIVPRAWVETFDVGRLFQGSRAERLGMALVATLLAPLAEEVAFRGYVLSALRTHLRPEAAIAASSVLFAAMHLDPVRFPAVVFLGVFLGWLAWRSGSLWPAVAAHAVNNGLGSLAVLGADGESPEQGGVVAALVVTALGLLALAPIAMAWIRATPAPPPAAEIVVRVDPAEPSIRFHPLRVAHAWLVVAIAGVLLWGLLGIFRVPER